MPDELSIGSKKRKRSSISSSASGSDMANLKSESDWHAGSLSLPGENEGALATTNSFGALESPEQLSLDYPDLPRISGELMLETFTHKSLCSAGSGASDASTSYSDNERLSEVGEAAINLAVTNYLYSKNLPVEVNGMSDERQNILSDENYDIWVKYYKLGERLRRSGDIDIQTPQETRSLFNAYAGAVYVHSGMRALGTWISRLIDPGRLPINPDDTRQYSLPPQNNVFRQHKQSNHRDAKRAKSEASAITTDTSSSSASGYDASQASAPTPPKVPPPPPAQLPPPVMYSGTGIYSAPAVNYVPQQTAYGSILPLSQSKGVHYLPKFNEYCAKQKLAYEYQAENYGSPHAPKWVVKLLITGIHKGTGQASNKQAAKEEAAKQAFFAMGWIA